MGSWSGSSRSAAQPWRNCPSQFRGTAGRSFDKALRPYACARRVVSFFFVFLLCRLMVLAWLFLRLDMHNRRLVALSERSTTMYACSLHRCSLPTPGAICLSLFTSSELYVRVLWCRHVLAALLGAGSVGKRTTTKHAERSVSRTCRRRARGGQSVSARDAVVFDDRFTVPMSPVSLLNVALACVALLGRS